MKIKTATLLTSTIITLMSCCVLSAAAPLGNPSTSCEEIRLLYEADQADRVKIKSSGASTWQTQEMIKMSQQDAERRKRTQELLTNGKLRSADDYYHAAMIMQHGDKADEFLLSHILATASLKLGRKKSAWLVAASLDRYLMKIGQPQIFGSQFNNLQPADPSKWTNEPYNDKLVSDSLRKIYYQPTHEEIKKRLDLLKNNKPLATTLHN